MAPASAERALRPSSRQDILGGGADPHPPPQQHKAGSGQQAAAVTPALAEAAPATGAASQQPADGEVAMAGISISISIVPPAEGNEGNDSCLVLLLQGQAQQALPGTAAAMPAVPAAAAAGESALEEGEVRPVVLLAETAWLNSSEAGEVEAMLDAQQVSCCCAPPSHVLLPFSAAVRKEVLAACIAARMVGGLYWLTNNWHCCLCCSACAAAGGS